MMEEKRGTKRGGNGNIRNLEKNGERRCAADRQKTRSFEPKELGGGDRWRGGEGEKVKSQGNGFPRACLISLKRLLPSKKKGDLPLTRFRQVSYFHGPLICGFSHETLTLKGAR